MSARTARVTGLPMDRLFALYLLTCIPALGFAYRPSTWPVLLLVHLAAAALLWPIPPIGRATERMSEPARRITRGVLDWAPLLLIPLLYTELAVLNSSVHGGSYFDDIIIRWEQALFGGQPSRDWAVAAPQLWLSEPLHFAYLSYYFIIFVPPLVLYLRGRSDDFRTGVLALMLSFFLHYLFFIYFPVQGPRYLFPPHTGELSSGYFFQLAHRVLEAGSAQGAAFPSSHVGVSVAQTIIVWRLLRPLTAVIALLTVGLALGAIYGGFHYATDALAGLVLGVIAVIIAPRLQRILTPRTV